jgi:hypothetical protein
MFQWENCIGEHAGIVPTPGDDCVPSFASELEVLDLTNSGNSLSINDCLVDITGSDPCSQS